MAQGFNTELKCQQEWGWLLTIWLFLGGSGSGLFLLFAIFDLPPFLALIAGVFVTLISPDAGAAQKAT